jgi:hypothetical protein
VGQEPYQRAMAHLAAVTRARGIPVVVLAQGFDTEAGEIARRAALANGFRVLDASPRLFAYLRQHGLDPADRDSRVRAFKLADGHPNALAHQLLAEVVYDELQRMGVAPPQEAPAPSVPPPPLERAPTP